MFVIGGAEIYREALPIADRIYLTLVDGVFDADAFFPEFDESDWKEVHRIARSVDEKNLYAHTFVTFERNK